MILARKLAKYPNFLIIFSRKINIIPEFYMIFARKMPEFYIIIARKICFSEFSGSTCSPAAVLPRLLYAYGVLSCLAA